jgi:TRAP-type C4-dicarboxylate transport system permease small subunit
MIPFIYFLIAWLMLLLLFLAAATVSILQMMRYGLAHPLTHASTALLVLLTAVVVLGTLGYLSGMDLQADFDLRGLFNIPSLAPTL